MFEKGKTYAKKIKNEQAKAEFELSREKEDQEHDHNQDIVKRLRDLAKLKEEGLISEEEFDLLKKRMLEKSSQ